MENEFIKQIGKQILVNYEKVSSILLDSKSYLEEVQINNVSKYLSFVNSSLEKPYGRIVHVYNFLSNENVMSDRMYPFCHLSKLAVMKIKVLYCQSDWIINGIREIAPRYSELLELEEHEVN